LVVLEEGKPRLFAGNDPDRDAVRMCEEGFEVVGYSSFNGRGGIDSEAALEQAQKVHASVVLVYSKYSHTVSGVAPLTLPKTQHSMTTLTGSAVGPGGMSTFSGTASSTNYGTNTTYVPYSVNKYDYFASYWVRLQPPIFGVRAGDLSPQIRTAIGSNRGARVVAVIKGSPAFDGDIVEGDIIKQLGDTEIADADALARAILPLAGKTVRVRVLREDKEIAKEIPFRASGHPFR